MSNLQMKTVSMVSKNSESIQPGTKRQPEEDKSEDSVDDFQHYVAYKKQTSNINDSSPTKSPMKRMNTARSLESPSPLKIGDEEELKD